MTCLEVKISVSSVCRHHVYLSVKLETILKIRFNASDNPHMYNNVFNASLASD